MPNHHNLENIFRVIAIDLFSPTVQFDDKEYNSS